MSPLDFRIQNLATPLQSVPLNPVLFDEAINTAKSSILSSNISLDEARLSTHKDSILGPAWVDQSITHSLDKPPSLFKHGSISFSDGSVSPFTQPDSKTTISPNYTKPSPGFCDQISPSSPNDSVFGSSYLDPALLTIQPINEFQDNSGDYNAVLNLRERTPRATENSYLLSPSLWILEDPNSTHNAHDVQLPNFGNSAFLEPQTNRLESELDSQIFQNSRPYSSSSQSLPSSTSKLTDSLTLVFLPVSIRDEPSPSTSVSAPNRFPNLSIGSSQPIPPLFENANHEADKGGSGNFLGPRTTMHSLKCPRCGKSFTQKNDLK